MNQYYLISQLPSLDGVDETSPLPITESEFYELCSRFLRAAKITALRAISLVPEQNGNATGSAVIDAWNQREKQLRLALGTIRAEILKKSFGADTEAIPTPLLQIARTAVAMENPLVAEQYLHSCRLAYLDQLRPMDSFCEDALFHYCLKLKLLTRMRQFNKERGLASYHKIYDSILNGGN